MRGQVFEIDGKKIFTFGGARSHDISGGILELNDPNFRAKKKKPDQGYEPYRINHLTWWEREMPSQEEMDEGRRNLEENDYTVDFIVSHCAASSTVALISHGAFEPDTLTTYLEEIRQKTEFKKWFFGHYHENRNVNANEILLYEQIIRVS
jgi:DNA repair exonuclease SbcCD nuclease subunit